MRERPVGYGLSGTGVLLRSQVGEHFLVIDAEEGFGGKGFLPAHFLSEGGAQRAAPDREEFGYTHPRGVYFAGGPHGGKERGRAGRCFQQEVHLVRERIDGVDDDIVAGEPEIGPFLVALFEGGDFCARVDLKKALFQDFHFGLPHGEGGGRELPVHVAHIHAVHIYQGEMADSASDERFRAPAAHAAGSEEDDAGVPEAAEAIGPYQALRTGENSVHSQDCASSRMSLQTSSRPSSFRISWRIPG